MDQEQKKPKQKRDSYRNIKWLGYLKVQLQEKSTLPDFVQFAKFQLAYKTKTLLKDPIWGQYTNEEILVEFFAHMFQGDKDARMRFEQEVGAFMSDADDFSNWVDKQMAKEETKIMGETEDHVSFSPKDVMGED